MALLKLQFPLQRRVRLAQSLWLLSWLAVLAGAFTFSLGVYLKTELLRRAEVLANTITHTCLFTHGKLHTHNPYVFHTTHTFLALGNHTAHTTVRLSVSLLFLSSVLAGSIKHAAVFSMCLSVWRLFHTPLPIKALFTQHRTTLGWHDAVGLNLDKLCVWLCVCGGSYTDISVAECKWCVVFSIRLGL